MLSKNINIPSEKIKRLFDNYGMDKFKCAINRLIILEILNKEEISFLRVFIKNIKNKSFFKKSYLIYLSNGIIENYGNTNDLKKQLLFELGVLSLQKKIIEKVDYFNGDLNLYSLVLNQIIGCSFDSIKKEDNYYLFSKENKIVLKIKENKELEIIKGVNFLMHNENPFHTNNDHPDTKFVECSLGGKSLKEWVGQFRHSYDIIKKYYFDVYDEITYFLDSIVPIGYEYKKQLSSSYSQSEGILYFSYTDTDIKQAEAIIHEVHHVMFNSINQVYPLLGNDHEQKYYSSYRPDARPLKGCLLGLHAFIAVQNFYKVLGEKMQNDVLSNRFINAYVKNEKMIEKLPGNDAQFSKIGESSFEDIKTKFNSDLSIRFIDAYIKNKKMIDIIQKYAQFSKMGELFFEDIKTKFNSDSSYFKTVSKKCPYILNKVVKSIDMHFVKSKNENDILLF